VILKSPNILDIMSVADNLTTMTEDLMIPHHQQAHGVAGQVRGGYQQTVPSQVPYDNY